MKPEIRKCNSPEQIEEAIHEAVERLAKGELIGVPTDFGYVAVCRGEIRFLEGNLLDLARWSVLDLPENSSSALNPSVLLLRSAEELTDFVSPIPARGMRLLSRFPPGTIELVISQSKRTGELANELRCRTSSGSVLSGVHSLSPWPLIASPFLPERGDFVNPFVESCHRLVDLLPKCLNYVIDTKVFEQRYFCAVVKCQADRVLVIESHGMTDSTILEHSGPCILFVCTGNTCRSPMAEAICRKLLADELNCLEVELAEKGIEVVSAGVAADFGSPASSEAVVLLEKEEVDLAQHRSQPLTEQLLDQADHVFTMTGYHRDVVLHHRADLEDRTFVLGVHGRDIPDPIGAGAEVYRQCKEAIVAGLRQYLDKLVAEI